jgi:hypothetical protein
MQPILCQPSANFPAYFDDFLIMVTVVSPFRLGFAPTFSAFIIIITSKFIFGFRARSYSDLLRGFQIFTGSRHLPIRSLAARRREWRHLGVGTPR